MASSNDEKVLSYIFNPFLAEGLVGQPENETSLAQQDVQLNSDQQEAISLEAEGVSLANSNQLEQALDRLKQALELWSTKASLYNNRAQVYRLMNREDEARQDLDTAIRLIESSSAAMDKATARQAYCQRALLRLKAEDKDRGLQDMDRAAKMGNAWASSFIARQNPYAALCNQMLGDMFRQYN